MALENAAPRQTSRVKSTIDTILLTTLLNREMNADGKVFEVKVQYVSSNGSWQIYVDNFRNTYMPVEASQLAKLEGAQLLVRKISEQLRKVMESKPVAGIGQPKATKPAKEEAKPEGDKQ